MRRIGCSYFRMRLERQYKVCNFGLKVEICWSLKRRGETHWPLKRRGETRWPLKRRGETRWSLKRRERLAGHSNEGRDRLVAQAKGRDQLATQTKGETRWSLKQTCQLHRVCSPAVTLLHKKGPRHRRNICANSLWLYSYLTQTSLSKNKNINYIFIYLRVFRCLSNGSIYDNIIL